MCLLLLSLLLLLLLLLFIMHLMYICVDFIQGACTESLDSQVQEAATHPPHP